MFNLRKVSLLVLIVFLSFQSNAQQKTLAKFIITSASDNGEDITPMILQQEAFCVFYTFEGDSLLYLSNNWLKNETQSYGPLFPAVDCILEEAEKKRGAEVSNYLWYFMNTYDDQSGTAQVQLTKIKKVLGVSFVLKIITPNNDILEYYGYDEDALDFSTH
jgi:hypothetical protein